MTVTANVDAAQAQLLRRLIDRAPPGQVVLITHDGATIARLVPVATEKSNPPARRQSDRWRGQIKISDNFEDPLPPDIQDALEGKAE
jgi:antitoxin (DNA-binding transcriptional repressor) of toxin-antitoxin stability system